MLIHSLYKARGFTLIEVMVSVAIFAVVMTIALGALLAISDADRRAEAYKSVVDNLNFALDSMSRTIRTGTGYDCGNTGSPHDCAPPGSATSLGVVAADGSKVVYAFDPDPNHCSQSAATAGCITRSVNGGQAQPLTSSEIQITNLQFIVNGVSDSKIQPKITVLVSGSIQVVPSAPATIFNLETSITQRIYDQ